MSNISIKKDFADGDILPASDLNNNFRVIEAGINANDEQLEQVIEDAIVRLDAELEAITANRGWDWNGGDRVTFYKGETEDIEDRDIVDGQLLYNTETGETYLDDSDERIVTGSGNVVAIADTEPENPATKLWIIPDEQLNNVGTEVVNSMSGNETTMAPSVSAVKGYVGASPGMVKVYNTVDTAWSDDTYTKVPLGSTAYTDTDKLTLSNSEVTVGSGVNYLLVTISLTAWDPGSYQESLTLKRTRGATTINLFTASNGYTDIVQGSIVVPVEEGDKLWLQAWQKSGASRTILSGQERTFMNIMILG